MADPMTKLDGTEVGTTIVTRWNDNFQKRLWLDLSAKTAAYTATVDDELITVDPTSAAVTIKMEASPTAGRRLWVQALNVAHTVTLDGNGHNVNGAGTKTIGTAGRRVELVYDGTQWDATYADRL